MSPNSNPDPFADDDPLDPPPHEAASAPPTARAETLPDDDFDALGFDSGFGLEPGALTPGGFGAAPGGLHDDDDTPPGGIYVGEEEVQVLDASAVGRALAEAEGRAPEQPPDLEALQKGLVGVDIGAAVAVVARFNDHGQHEIVPNQHDDLFTPVQVFFDDDGERLVGREARLMAASAPDRAVVDIKAAIADPAFKRRFGDRDVDAEEVLGVLVRRLLDDAEEHAGERPTHLALAAPAWFGEPQRAKLRRAAEASGATVVGIADEALAAAVPYSLRLPDLNLRQALVVDLGHAALGVSVVRCVQGDIQVLAQESRTDLGSACWDKLLEDEAVRVFKEKFGFDPRDDASAALDLRLRAEDAKRALSQRPNCALVAAARGKSIKVGFTRKGFEHAARPLIEGARQLMISVRDEAGVSDWSRLHALILTGGGSRTPALKRMVKAETKLEPERGINPEEGVAVGALYWGIGERHRLSRA